MKLPICTECGHQFGWMEMIKSQWNVGLKEIHCKVCDTKFKIKNSFFLHLLPFMGPYIISNLVWGDFFISSDLSFRPLAFLVELTPLFILFVMISLTLPYFAKLGRP